MEEDSIQMKENEENYEKNNIIMNRPIELPINQEPNDNSMPINLSQLHTNNLEESYQKKKKKI